MISSTMFQTPLAYGLLGSRCANVHKDSFDFAVYNALFPLCTSTYLYIYSPAGRIKQHTYYIEPNIECSPIATMTVKVNLITNDACIYYYQLKPFTFQRTITYYIAHYAHSPDKPAFTHVYKLDFTYDRYHMSRYLYNKLSHSYETQYHK